MKQEYKKPQVVKVSLKVEQTVMGGCKLSTVGGQNENDCVLPACVNTDEQS